MEMSGLNKVIVKWTFRIYAYPLDVEQVATKIALKQAELMANESTSKESDPT